MAFEGLTEKLNATFKRLRGKGRLTENDVREAMREVRLALLEADVSYKVVKDFVASVTERAVGTDVLDSLTPAQQVVKIVSDELTKLMGGANAKIAMANNGPTVVMMVGLQGAGKTTTTAKLGGLMRKQLQKRPLLAACDVYRPAAIEQLKVVGGQLDLPVFEQGRGDPVEIAQNAIRHARDHGSDMVFLDTAGRLHVDEELMDELKRMKAAVHPNEILLVVDAMTGQDAVNAASAFDEALGIDGVILTKLDGDARGGAALSIRAATGKPIKFAGTGEKLDMIEPFHPDRMASRILGMGDVLSFIEKAEAAYDEKQAAKLEEKLRKNRFTLQDYYDQLQQLRGMGDLSQLAGMMPGGLGKQLQGDRVLFSGMIFHGQKRLVPSLGYLCFRKISIRIAAVLENHILAGLLCQIISAHQQILHIVLRQNIFLRHIRQIPVMPHGINDSASDQKRYHDCGTNHPKTERLNPQPL